MASGPGVVPIVALGAASPWLLVAMGATPDVVAMIGLPAAAHICRAFQLRPQDVFGFARRAGNRQVVVV